MRLNPAKLAEKVGKIGIVLTALGTLLSAVGVAAAEVTEAFKPKETVKDAEKPQA